MGAGNTFITYEYVLYHIHILYHVHVVHTTCVWDIPYAYMYMVYTYHMCMVWLYMCINANVFVNNI